MTKALLVAQREYYENIKTKGFWIGTLLMPLLFGISIIVPTWLDSTRSAKTFTVIDHSGWLVNAVERELLNQDLPYLLNQANGELQAEFPDSAVRLGQAFGSLTPERQLAFIAALQGNATQSLAPETLNLIAAQGPELLRWWRELPKQEVRHLLPESSRRRYQRVTQDASVEQLTAQVRDGSLFAFFVIESNPEQGNRYYSANLTDRSLKEWYTGLLGAELRKQRMVASNVTAEVASWIAQPFPVTDRFVSESGETEADTADKVSQWVPVAFVYLLWISVFSVSMMMLTSTVLEKSNRLVEVLLSSISPIELMAGKILGSAATGLTTVGTWLISFLVLVHFLPAMLGIPLGFSLSAVASSPAYLISFVVYFTLGYLFYGALLVGLGSVCDNLKDAQNMASPVSMTLFLPLMLMMPIGEDPNGTLAKVCSYIPPLTPFVMMNRAAGPPTLLEYCLTTALMIASVALALWAAAKVFRIGILVSGKPPKLRELWRWIVTSS